MLHCRHGFIGHPAEQGWQMCDYKGQCGESNDLLTASSCSCHIGVVPSATMQSRDGKYVIIGGNGDSVYSRLMAAVGRPEMGSQNPMYATNTLRCTHADAIYQASQHTSSSRAYQCMLCGPDPHTHRSSCANSRPSRHGSSKLKQACVFTHIYYKQL